jgi:hypothetical protein
MVIHVVNFMSEAYLSCVARTLHVIQEPTADAAHLTTANVMVDEHITSFFHEILVSNNLTNTLRVEVLPSLLLQSET